MVDKQLRDGINAITVTDRFGERKKKRMSSGQLKSPAHHSPLSYMQLDMTETIIAELSQSVHHLTLQ